MQALPSSLGLCQGSTEMNFVSSNLTIRIGNFVLPILLITLLGVMCPISMAQPDSTNTGPSSDPYFSAEKSETVKASENEPSTDPDRQRILENYHVTEIHEHVGQTNNTFQEGQVLAIVGGEPIFVGDVMFEANQLLERFMAGAPAKMKLAERPKLIKRLLPKFIDQKLLLLHAQTKLPEGASFDDIVKDASKEFDEKALEALMEQSGAKSIVEFDAQLRAQGSSLRQMRRSWTVDQLVRLFVMKDIRSEANVTHHQLLDYYRDNITEFEHKARAKWEQVMVSFARSDSRAHAHKTIVEIGNKIVYGASLPEVAKNASHGFNAHNGGLHDWTTEGSLVLKEIDKAIFSLPVGELSDVIETSTGFHIVRVVERENAHVTSFRDAQVEIRKKLEQKKRESMFEEQLTKLRRQTPVEIFDLSTPPGRLAERPNNGDIR